MGKRAGRIAVYGAALSLLVVGGVLAWVFARAGLDGDEERWVLVRPATRTATQAATTQQTPSIPQNSGFVFYESRYLDPPYVVTRVGFTVQINGQVVDQRGGYEPEPRYVRVGPARDPGPPKGFTRQSTPDDVTQGGPHGRPAQMYRKWDYLKENSERDKAIGKLLAYLREYPCFAEVTLESSKCLSVQIRHASGDKYGIMFEDDECEQEGHLSEAEVVAGLERTRKRLETYLGEGDCFFFAGNGGSGYAQFGARDLGRRLADAVAALRSDASLAEKATALMKAGIRGHDKDPAHDSLLAKPFQASPDLERRIAALMGARPGEPATRPRPRTMPTTNPNR